MDRFLLLVVLLWCTSLAGPTLAQNTVGLLEFDEVDMADGYMLIHPAAQGTAFLLNACGQVVHTWPDATSEPGNGCRLIADGALMRTYVENGTANPFFAVGGAGGSVQIKDWDNNILWDYDVSSTTECAHHDAEVLPNGNVLLIVWELKTMQEAWDAGRDTTGFGYTSFWPDKIIEVQPMAPDAGTVVWEWHAWDHLVQDFNAAANNFGVVADHPELINVNRSYTNGNRPDWLHINSVDYNPTLDQIMLSVPFFNEIWIIDHSTTTAEAASHSGGNSGRGGDLLYRWGNPLIYDQGTVADQDLFFNHAALWVGPGLATDDPDAGKIMVFNNRAQPGVSTVDILVPPVDVNGQYAYVPGTAYGPLDREQRFATNPPTSLFSPGQGSGQKLANGNVLACSGAQGWVRQLRPDSSVAWSYRVPMDLGVPVPQGSTPLVPTVLFQAEWITPDDPRIQGRVLDPIGYIELNPNEAFCELTTTVHEGHRVAGLSVVGNAVTDLLTVNAEEAGAYAILDAMGRTVRSVRLFSGRNVVAVDDLAPGGYVLRSLDANRMGARFHVLDN